jgi:phytoene desaturase
VKQRTAIVIGAGIAGIGAAAHLARRGYRVTVLEKNSRPGGRCDHFTHRGHRFDTGPTLLIMPRVYESEFDALGASFWDELDLRRIDPTYHLVFDDGSRLALTSDLPALQSQLEALEPGSFDGFLRYRDEGQRHYDIAMQHLVDRDFRHASDFFSIGNLPLLAQVKPLVPHYANMGRYFAHPRLKAAFTFQDVYMGLSPFEAPATFSMMSYTELAHGCWYPRGGMYSVVRALTGSARRLGVRFVFNTSVRRIDVHKGRARGVVL